ncbi:MAG: enoyl-ACP reductase [Symbiobacteriaceae bacterium]|nr:enoyl-ACP reductase [Symbiobacteriaceae bacterium]
MLLAGKRFLITGVSNQWSIAWGVAKALAEQGGQLGFTYLNDRAKDNIIELCTDAGIAPAFILPCDVSSDVEIAAMADQLEQIWRTFDGFLHSLAHARREDLSGAYFEVSREGFLHAMNISAYSFTALARILKPLLNEGSSLVTLTYLGSERAVSNYNVMGVAKAALEASVRYLARDFGLGKIRVNAVSPGPIKTLSARGINDFSSLLDYFESRVLLDEVVSADSIAGTVVYLFSDLSRPVTGEIVHVDAGFHIVA